MDPTAAVRNLLGHAEDAEIHPTPYVEATLRAWRNLLLEEAVELEEALRYWNTRSERPLLAYVESGNCTCVDWLFVLGVVPPLILHFSRIAGTHTCLVHNSLQ